MPIINESAHNSSCSTGVYRKVNISNYVYGAEQVMRTHCMLSSEISNVEACSMDSVFTFTSHAISMSFQSSWTVPNMSMDTASPVIAPVVIASA